MAESWAIQDIIFFFFFKLECGELEWSAESFKLECGELEWSAEREYGIIHIGKKSVILFDTQEYAQIN